MKYAIFFDHDHQDLVATTAEQAVAACFGYLITTVNDFIDEDEAVRWNILIDEPDEQHPRMKPCSATHAKWALEDNKRIELFAETTTHGIIGTATAMDEVEWEKQEEEIARFEAFAKLQKDLKENDESVNQHIKQIALISKVRPGILDYPSRDIGPKQILQAAEVRIFAHNLYYALSETEKSFDDIEDQCGLAKGSLLKMINPFDPLMPPKEMVQKLANALELEPHMLWYDAVGAYFAHYFPTETQPEESSLCFAGCD